VIKKLWTPSFVLVAAGWSAVLFAVFFWLIDVRGWVRWTSPFLWIGANPIFLYLLGGMGVFQKAGERLAGKGSVPSSWLAPIAGMVVLLLVARWLYQRRIFIRL
jgi:predicted acyltransferase